MNTEGRSRAARVFEMPRQAIGREAVYAECDRILSVEGTIEAVTERRILKSLGGGRENVKLWVGRWKEEKKTWLGMMPTEFEARVRRWAEEFWLLAGTHIRETGVSIDSKPDSAADAGANEMISLRETVGRLERAISQMQGLRPKGPETSALRLPAPAPSNSDLPDFSELSREEEVGRPKRPKTDSEANKKRLRTADWAGAKDRVIAKIVANALRTAGEPLRNEELRGFVKTEHPDWNPKDLEKEFLVKLDGSNMFRVGRGLWWFRGEPVRKKPSTPTEQTLKRRRADIAFTKVLDMMKREKRAMWPTELLAVAKITEKFTHSWLHQRFRDAMKKGNTNIVKTAEGFLWKE